jgi:hypothetical protein
MVDAADKDGTPWRALLRAVMDGDLDTLASTCFPFTEVYTSIIALTGPDMQEWWRS